MCILFKLDYVKFGVSNLFLQKLSKKNLLELGSTPPPPPPSPPSLGKRKVKAKCCYSFQHKHELYNRSSNDSID